MPNATPQDAEEKFYTTISGSFGPDNANPPISVRIPSGCTLTRTGVGQYDLLLPAYYTPDKFQNFGGIPSVYFGQLKVGANDTAIPVQTLVATLPTVRWVLTNPAGAATEYGPGPVITFQIRLKYFTVLTF